MRLCVLFRVPPGQIDELMTGKEAAELLEYLSEYPETADTVDLQMARILKCIGAGDHIDELRVRRRAKTEADEAMEWIRYIDERKNRP
jgi:hypothetical protein